MMKLNPTIVIDHNIPEFWNNRVLDRVYMKQFPGATVLTDLAESAQKAGYCVMTADIFLSQNIQPKVGLILTEIDTQYTDALIKRGLIPAICTCAESPIIAHHFYHNLSRYVGRFEHAFLFGGASPRLQGTKTRFHPFFWPNTSREVLPGQPWSQREFLVMVNSNKRAFQLNQLNLREPRHVLKAFYQYLKGRYVRSTDLWMCSDLYVERLAAIEYFSQTPNFDLFGMGWSTSGLGPGRKMQEVLQKSYRGLIPSGPENKQRVISNYKYAICFENTSFPGYITEKIFDCFFAGCIPIYYGAPDINNHIPPETFIDFRDFGNYAELENYLLGLSDDDAKKYRTAAEAFLASAAFNKFHASHFVESVLQTFNEVVARHA